MSHHIASRTHSGSHLFNIFSNTASPGSFHPASTSGAEVGSGEKEARGVAHTGGSSLILTLRVLPWHPRALCCSLPCLSRAAHPRTARGPGSGLSEGGELRGCAVSAQVESPGRLSTHLGASSARGEVLHLTCFRRAPRSSCVPNGTYGKLGLCVTSPATHSGLPNFPTRLGEIWQPQATIQLLALCLSS